jgi:hypothetical protein
VRIFSDKKQKLLSEISVQCSVAQNCIARCFDNPDSNELLAALLTLKVVLDSFLEEQAKT